MAENKNQHFVPRCYLSSFSDNMNGNTISLYNLSRRLIINSAPIRNQCSGNYFYGDNPYLEEIIQIFERKYAKAIRCINSADYRLNQADSATLRQFWLLQHLRTEAASRRQVDVAAQMDQDLRGLPEGYELGIKEAVQISMRVFLDIHNAIDDLKLRLIRNKTDVRFITSDNPAALTNRWHLTDKIAKFTNPGLGSAGAIAFLPLTPSICCVIFDGDIYSMPHSGGWVELYSAEDAIAINEHQVLNCQSNIYFPQETENLHISSLIERSLPNKPAKPFRINYAVLDKVEGNHKRYRVVSAEEAIGQQAIIHTENITPNPTRWPSILKWRQGGVAYDSGSGLGFLRRATRERASRHARVRIRP